MLSKVQNKTGLLSLFSRMNSSNSTEVTIYFRIQYTTYPGQQLFVIGDHPLLGDWARSKALEMQYSRNNFDQCNWIGKISFRKPKDKQFVIEYKYIVLTSAFEENDPYRPKDVRLEKEAEIQWDSGPNRKIIIGSETKSPFIVVTKDLFQDTIETLGHVFLKMPFKNIVYMHKYNPFDKIINSDIPENHIQIRFRLIAMQVPPSCKLMITGDATRFKNWTKFEELRPISDLYWEYCIDVPNNEKEFQYKYVLMGPNGEYEWEHRPNRTFSLPEEASSVFIINDWVFKMPVVKFHGAGLIAPLFSVRSRSSFQGMGEFGDIKLLVDWAVAANLLLIHLGPIQDTNYIGEILDANPSFQVSAFAFNPVYLTLKDIDGFENIKKERRTDYKTISKAKVICLKSIFSKIDQQRFFSDSNFQLFISQNKEWLPSYCLWCSLRDEWLEKYPNTEPKFPEYNPSLEINFSDNKILFHAWVQYQCHLQLKAASEYAVKNRVILVTTMTIGQQPHSADTWAHPEWFDLRYNIGSPPDIFSFHGQNWGYPSWDFERMKADGHKWLRMQMAHRERYFHAALFDHPLGLFRCWKIPSNVQNPLLGHFDPSIPIDTRDLHELHIRDISRLCRPLFPIQDVLSFALPEPMKERIINTFATCEGGVWLFRSKFVSDKEVSASMEQLSRGLPMEQKLQFSLAEKILLSHYESVCLIPDNEEPHRKYYPRFAMTDSTIFKSLPERDAQVLYKLFVDFFYRTNLSLWHEQGSSCLSVLAQSGMAFIGYDLGVTLNDEEKALHRFGICSYRVQRIPRESTQRFDNTSQFPYLSVCTPSPHDLPHLSIWWRTEQADVQQFYHQGLRMAGPAPLSINEDITRAILKQHLESDSMWSVFVLEDLFALSKEFDCVGSDLWINVPSADHKWKYRVGVFLEDLPKHEKWTSEIAALVEESKRGRNCFDGFFDQKK